MVGDGALWGEVGFCGAQKGASWSVRVVVCDEVRGVGVSAVVFEVRVLEWRVFEAS